MGTNSKFPITRPEYERIFRIIHAVASNEKADPSRACLFFGIAGASILKTHHRLKAARPVAGAAGYNLKTPENLILAFGSQENGHIISHQNGFHCWIEVDDWIIDFTAPLFDTMAPMERKGANIPSCMFQKKVSIRHFQIEDLNPPGLYAHSPNEELTELLVSDFLQHPAKSDLVSICTQWYNRKPEKILSSIQIGNQHGKLNTVKPSSIRVTGTW